MFSSCNPLRCLRRKSARRITSRKKTVCCLCVCVVTGVDIPDYFFIFGLHFVKAVNTAAHFPTCCLIGLQAMNHVRLTQKTDNERVVSRYTICYYLLLLCLQSLLDHSVQNLLIEDAELKTQMNGKRLNNAKEKMRCDCEMATKRKIDNKIPINMCGGNTKSNCTIW